MFRKFFSQSASNPDVTLFLGKPFMVRAGSPSDEERKRTGVTPTVQPQVKQSSQVSVASKAAQAISPEGAVLRRKRLSLLGQS